MGHRRAINKHSATLYSNKRSLLSADEVSGACRAGVCSGSLPHAVTYAAADARPAPPC